MVVRTLSYKYEQITCACLLALSLLHQKLGKSKILRIIIFFLAFVVVIVVVFIFQFWRMDLMSISSIISVLFGSHLLMILAVDDLPANNTKNLETYIVHVESPDLQLATQMVDLDDWYRSFLPTTTTASTTTMSSSFAEELQTESRLVYSYHNVFKGFAARLSKEEVKEMEKKKGFIFAQPQQILSLHTTHTPNFLGLIQNSGLWKDSNYGKGVIIGFLDSGIKPTHPSFSDEGMPPPPAKWKGRCQFSVAALCNNKLIGARYFMRGYGLPIDENGHGTHTASTAAGNYVHGANVFGNANGTASGVAPLAHLAIYKVCNRKGCAESDIVAAMDAAIGDGVDIISLSLGGASRPFHMDSIAIGAFRAMEKGIFVSASAGNRGPSTSTVTNEAPWILNVGASTTDRKIISTAKLGNNQELEGQSVYQPKDFRSSLLHLVYPGLDRGDDENNNAAYCLPRSFDRFDVRGKIVVCMEGGGISPAGKGRQVKAAGGAGMILINEKESGYTITDDPHVLPATHLCYYDGLRVLNYIRSSKSPTAAILFKGTSINGDSRAPLVASFSSRGPNSQSLGILKPDIIGPGVNIFAAWPVSVEHNNAVDRTATFNIISGTSMSCPHLSGVAALLKSAHPDWSPAVIKSAIITTADTVNLENKPIEDEMHKPANIFATGAGHVNPSKANTPGLVYDIQPSNYVSYLCGLNYTNMQVTSIAQRMVDCSKESSIPEGQLNYPSFSVFLGSSAVQRYTRTVTNVGEAIESYTVQVVQPPGVNVTVEPTTLSFTRLNQKMSYVVTFTKLETAENKFAQGYLAWNSAKHSVRSPVVAIFNAPS